METSLPERNLDVLRAVAVLCVVVDHVLMVTVGPPVRALAWSLGLFGVYCFFVHTSLVLMSSLERQTAGRPLTWRETGAFYVRRLCRILPLVWAVIALALLIHIPVFPTIAHAPPTVFVAPTLRELVANLAVSQNLIGARDLQGPLWSLPIEMQMYVVLPAAFLLACRSVRRVVVALVLAAIVATVFVFGASAHVPGLWRVTLLQYVPCFVPGVLAYALLRRRPPSVPAWVFALVVPGAFALFFVATGFGTMSTWGWLACVGLGLAVSVVRDQAPSRLTAWAKTIATYSYGVYLLHTPALWVSRTVMTGEPVALRAVTFVVLTAGGSWAAYHIIEQPGVELGRWLAARRTHGDTALGLLDTDVLALVPFIRRRQ